MVVRGRTGPEVRGAAGMPETGGTPEAGAEGATVGTRVMVDGIAVTMPGFWGTQVAQIPVK